MTVINPGWIFGPALIEGDFPSGQVIANIMNGKGPGHPKIMMPLVDMRDVAVVHL